ncbi:MAG: protein-export chaperone SecB [Acetobacter sp.]|uniref:protein-export chaperone SecB n=1 Tax=Acetobacter sp. TaxID=440 RepID=UPI003F8FA290
MTGRKQHLADSLGGSTNTPSTPSMLVGIQYSKAVMFQVYNAPAVYTRTQERPHTAIVVDVKANQLAENQPSFEVELILRCQGQNNPMSSEEKTVVLFEASLTYAGIFTLQNSTPETLEPLLLIEAPRLLFPAARNLITTLSREAGFLPIVIQQIDFAELWRSRRAAR